MMELAPLCALGHRSNSPVQHCWLQHITTTTTNHHAFSRSEVKEQGSNREGKNTWGKTSILRITSITLTTLKNLDVLGLHDIRIAKFHGSKNCTNRSAYLGPARYAYRVSAEAGRGGATVLPPQASPLVYTAREKDPHQGLTCLRVGPSVPLARGLQSCQGA